MTSAQITSTQRNLLVNAEQIRALYSQLPKSTAGMVAGGLVVIGAMWNQVSSLALLVWFAAIFLNQSWRLYLLLRYRRNPPAPEDAGRWGGYWAVGAGISGIIWGSAGIFMFVPDAPGYQAFLIIALFAVTTGALTLIAVHAPSFYAFVIPAILPVIVRTALEGGALHLFIAAACFLVLVMLLAFGRNLNKLLAQSLHDRFENIELITELKAQKQIAEQAQQLAEAATRARTQFFAAASHDLRQPLHAMGLFTAVLSERVRDPEVRNVIDSINSSVQALETLFNELLDISKIEAGAIKPEPAHFPVDSVFSRLRDEFAAEAGAKGLRLSISSGGQIIVSDAVLLERILRNLLSNAIRHTSAGEVALSARSVDGRLQIEVRDTGVGIRPEDHQRIYEEFFQLGNPGRTSGKGLGLGLSIVKRLCGLLGYDLRLTSEYGKGSTFSFDVPLGTVLAPRSSAPAASADRMNLSGKLIVVIDDEAAIVDGMKALLSSWGADVIGSLTGEDVLDSVLAREQLPDLVIADYRLAGSTTGIDIIERLREAFDPELPAVLVTGSSAPETIAEAERRRLGILLKPVLPDRLRECIESSLKAKPA
jgi:signal transduction histidine kinase/CheY-like chemotaxis protein